MVTYLANRFDVQCLKINIVYSLCKFVRLKIQNNYYTSQAAG